MAISFFGRRKKIPRKRMCVCVLTAVTTHKSNSMMEFIAQLCAVSQFAPSIRNLRVNPSDNARKLNKAILRFLSEIYWP